ncbi:flagellar basal body rod modification protein [Clostridium puniceum]|uniref:Basal-body rod modification protein FlgD n=1 Tax=Clostridium puniceum TaxID=29367 RepID=A0A1S8TBA8_9CLOT|nr:flagellar hook capping FlgD N-terminal domain-containing protein [Clostridium puniceum]OOM75028.1 flagellar basal body rod modification protein [Clostridium puniceum]
MSDTKVNSLNYTTVNIASSGTTDRGTKIVAKNAAGGNMDKNAFLKILAAQLSNLDPTQNQDSSAYVSQMAQFASMEQMTNLNTTMSDSAYQQMVGKTVITSEKDNNNNYVQGYVAEVIKKSSGTYLNMLIDGKYKEVAVSNIIGVTAGTDTNAIANSKAALNSDFTAASALAADKKNIVIAEYDSDGNATLVRGTVSGAYIDTVNGASVKIKVDVLDADGKSTTKTYDYDNIIRAGDLTTEEMDAAEKAIKDKTASTTSSTQSTATGV